MVIGNQWGIWKISNTERAQRIRDLILNESWWAHVAYVLDFTEPIMTMLIFPDTDTPCLGDVYDGMDTMVEKVKHSIQAHESDSTQCEALCKQVQAIIHHPWNKMTTPLHLLAYALSHRYYSEEVVGMPVRVAPFADEEVVEGCHKALARLFPLEEMHEKVREEFGLFASGLRHSPFALKDQNRMGAITWWYMYGQPFKHLQPLAIKVLSQVAISSTAERNWSTYSFIHSVKHNRLGSKKAEDLVFVHTNLCLLSRKNDLYKDGAAKLWDVAPECADLDATLYDLIIVGDSDDDSMAHFASSINGTMFSSDDLSTVGDDDETVDFLVNPYDSDSDSD